MTAWSDPKINSPVKVKIPCKGVGDAEKNWSRYWSLLNFSHPTLETTSEKLKASLFFIFFHVSKSDNMLRGGILKTDRDVRNSSSTTNVWWHLACILACCDKHLNFSFICIWGCEMLILLYLTKTKLRGYCCMLKGVHVSLYYLGSSHLIS